MASLTISSAILFLTMAGPTVPATGPESTSAVSEASTIEALARLLENDFVYPEVGKRYAAMLRDPASARRYAALSGAALAERLTADLQAVQPDGHLRVRHLAKEEAVGGIPPAANGKKLADIEQARWLAPGIAFVRLNLFPPDPQMLAATRKFLSDHASARTLIFDIRTNRGGTPLPIDEIAAWLYPKPTRLVTMSMRRSVEQAMRGANSSAEGEEPEAPPSLRQIAGTPQTAMREHWSMPNGDKRLHKAKVYVLTSPRTASAAEHLAFALKLTGRATLVGSATAGANHFGGEQPLPGGYAVFVPFGRTFDPKTGADWEGVGVVPHLAAPPEEALTRVLQAEGISQEQARRLSRSVAPTGSMLPRP